nr:hypothetical protein [uncultured Albidiferax sp.]
MANPKKKLIHVSLSQILDQSFPGPKQPISARSLFRDWKWDFRDAEKGRLTSVSDSRMIIDWARYLEPPSEADDGHEKAYLSRMVTAEIRLVAFFYYHAPGNFGAKQRSARTKPNTLTGIIRSLVVLFSEIDELREQYHNALVALRLSPGRFVKLRSLSEVCLEDLRDVVAESKRVDGRSLKRGLDIICSPLFRGRFAGELQWNKEDLTTLEFRYPQERANLRRNMPDELFRFLSDTASEDVTGFLQFLGRSPADQSSPPNIPNSLRDISNGEACFDCYVEIRDRDRAAAHRRGKKIADSKTLRDRLRNHFGVSPIDVFTYLLRVRNAALTVVGLYTGARWSDYSSFVKGCIQIRHGHPVLVGTLVKGQDVDAPEQEDIWPAIPILLDAVACLEELSRVTHNPYLFSASDTVPIGAAPLPLSVVGFTTAINDYLSNCDVNGDWAAWRINPHQLRHTLANQLAKADVGTVFISYQLKHLYTALASLPADVTLGYGNLAQQRMDRAVAQTEANMAAARALFHPDAPVAGGGATEFRKRRKVYFEGKAAAGWSIDETIQVLAGAGMPFVSVGPGYCGGVREETLKDGSTRAPPCIGDLQCNPGECQQAVVTLTHKRHWERIVEKNEEMATDPRLQHAKENFEKAIRTGRKVLADLAVGS